jgi:hypothetical protein
MNRPVGQWAHLSWQASAIRWGRTYNAERGEWWATVGADLTVPLDSSVESTLEGRYSQLHFYVEAVRRYNYEGIAGRDRSFLSGSAEYMLGPWVLDLSTTQRWTDDRTLPSQKDELYSASIGYTLPSQTILSFGLTHEKVDTQKGLYAGIRLTQTFTLCSKCMVRGRYF